MLKWWVDFYGLNYLEKIFKRDGSSVVFDFWFFISVIFFFVYYYYSVVSGVVVVKFCKDYEEIKYIS